jgi:hypothetical protein
MGGVLLFSRCIFYFLIEELQQVGDTRTIKKAHETLFGGQIWQSIV